MTPTIEANKLEPFDYEWDCLEALEIPFQFFDGVVFRLGVDVFEAYTDEQLDQLFAVITLTPQHKYQLLTRSSERMAAYFGDDLYDRSSDWAEAAVRFADIAAIKDVEWLNAEIEENYFGHGFAAGLYLLSDSATDSGCFLPPNLTLSITPEGLTHTRDRLLERHRTARAALEARQRRELEQLELEQQQERAKAGIVNPA